MECVIELGKSGYLPDISSAFSFWRAYAVNRLDQKDYNGATSGLYNINSLLTESYIVSIDTTQYNKQTEESIFYQCRFCNNETSQSNIQVFDYLLPLDEQIISGEKYVKSWKCPECKKLMARCRTNIIKDKLESPYYRRIVPECPTRGIGLQKRISFPQQFDKWFYNFLEELQHALALYRIEYVAQNGEDMMDVGFKENGKS